MLVANQLTKRYHQGEIDVTAIENLNYQFGPGATAIVGPSGSGKTTLLNLLAGFDVPTAGEVLIDIGGKEVALSSLGENARAEVRLRRMGFVFQQWSLIPTLTAQENVAFPMLLAGKSTRKRLERAATLLEQVGLNHRLKHLPYKLSGGEQQRVAIARSLALNPPILFADEPTGNLDSGSGAKIVELLLSQAKAGKTLVLVTHDLEVARKADRIVHLRDGKLIGVEQLRDAAE